MTYIIVSLIGSQINSSEIYLLDPENLLLSWIFPHLSQQWHYLFSCSDQSFFTILSANALSSHWKGFQNQSSLSILLATIMAQSTTLTSIIIATSSLLCFSLCQNWKKNAVSNSVQKNKTDPVSVKSSDFPVASYHLPEQRHSEVLQDCFPMCASPTYLLLF